MNEQRSIQSRELEATRLAVAWEIVSRSEINKADPLHAARMVRQVLSIFRDPDGQVGAHPVSPRESKGAAGGSVRLGYSFSGGPTSFPLTVFVHFIGDNGNIVFQDDHHPPRPTVFWSERTTYSRDVVVPPGTPRGLYRIRLGLYDQFGSHERLDLDPREGAVAADYRSCEVGTVRIG
jgi:hypothetical protein